MDEIEGGILSTVPPAALSLRLTRSAIRMEHSRTWAIDKSNPVDDLVICLEGRGEYLIDGDRRTMEPGDAMLITRLFKALFQRRVLLLVTSNYPPEGLLPNPLYHARFKPVIELINSRMQIMEVGGPHDYRSQMRNHAHQVFTQGRYVWPATPAQREALNLPTEDAPAISLTVGTRPFRARFCEDRRVGFTFADLCEQPTAVMDYLQLCRRFDHWIIDGLPELGECSIAAQQRFINLIDVLYDQDKHLTLLGRLPLSESLAGQVIDLARTRSRLGQLQEEHSTD